MTVNINEMDQSNWVCYQFDGKDYYYGQVAYVDENGEIHPKDSVEMASNPKAKLVKHGFGIYIYNSKPQVENSTRYEGNWSKDKKHGHGVLRLSDKSVYEGSFKEGMYHENGKMIWPNGCSFEGQWKRGRMDGPGNFHHYDGFSLKGSFRANYFVDENILRNPFFKQAEYVQFKKQRKQTLKQKEKNQKTKHGFIQKLVCNNKEGLIELIKKSASNNRVPLVVSSQKSMYSLKNLLQDVQNGQKPHNLDLRKAFVLKGEQKYNYKKQIQKMVGETLTKKGRLVINLDQSEVEYSQLFYPDIREFYDPEGLNPTIWSRSQTSRPEVHKKIIGQVPFDPDYLVIVWSKVKLSQNQQLHLIKQKIEKRFESVIPFIKIDIIYLTSNNSQ